MKILDLFCGAGGASMGISQAGHEVEGVDIVYQKEYPFKFYQGDAVSFLKLFSKDYDAFHASPPCQAFSQASRQWRNAGKEYPDYIDIIRKLLLETGKPFVIENVVGSPIRKDLLLCGQMFNLGVRRHRIFEIHGFEVPFKKHEKHVGRVGDGKIMSVFGHGGGVRYNHSSCKVEDWQKAMQIFWMSKKSLTQAIPPAYTRYIFSYLKETI